MPFATGVMVKVAVTVEENAELAPPHVASSKVLTEKIAEEDFACPTP